MSQSSIPLDILGFPFEGLQLIEASAGTGKTWTLSTLYLRLLLEPRPDGQTLLPPQILVMTFTDAATQELRDRIRRRIGDAVLVFRELDAPEGKTHDPVLLDLRQRRAREGWLADAQRLEAAAQWMDEAAIHTIHGWSSRMLRQHAFDSLSLFEQDRVEDPRALLEDVARDYWRRWFYQADSAVLAIAQHLPRSPDELLDAVRNDLTLLDRRPDATLDATPESPVDWLAGVAQWQRRFDAAQRAARDAWRSNLDIIETMLALAMANDLNKRNYPVESQAGYLQLMRDWCDGATLDEKGIQRFSQSRLNESMVGAALKKGRVAPTHAAFSLLDVLKDCGEPPPIEPLLAHATIELRKALAERKVRLAQFDFNDLLQRLYIALHDAGRGAQLAARLRELYPVALVDEFQDTDPWQYGALSRIYRPDHPTQAALVMIGDPKQAIYRFRGADLDTYLEARDHARDIHTLGGNFRSTQGLVDAVNHVFGPGAKQSPFGRIKYEPVVARNTDVQPLKDAQGLPLPALTAWYLPLEGPDPYKAPVARARLTEGFATQVVALLRDGAVKPADIAVLVRNGKEAQRVREALNRRNVRSVYLSERDSVYATPEAQDLWYILRAVAEPRSTTALRAALSTRIFDYGFDELDRLFQDEVRFEREAEAFADWQETWQKQGLLAMLYAVLHAQHLPARLLADREGGERRLTNLLHLGDLLQQASLQLQGEAAVVRFLAEQLRDRPQDEGASQLRLESDEGLVKVVTVHKSKGLQYPVVYVPFAFDFRPATSKDVDPDDADRMAEDLRLLYVALTRAERALFVGLVERNKDITVSSKGVTTGPKSVLSWLIGRRVPGDLPSRLAEAWGDCRDIDIVSLPAPTDERFEPDVATTGARSALIPTRTHRSNWRSSSFTAMTRGIHGVAPAVQRTPGSEADDRYGDAQVDNPEGASPPDLEAPTSLPATGRYQDFPGGARIGDLLHGLLEWQIEAGWPILAGPDGDAAQAETWAQTLGRRARLLGLDDGQQTLLHEWIGDLARAPLGASPVTAAPDLPALPALDGAWPEMGFVIPTRGVSVSAVDRLLRTHIQPGLPREALTAQDLDGQLTGFLDLVFESGGRYYVLDYKSNKLDGYGSAQLAAAVLKSRYELQYTLYLLALHRLLRSRLPDYDYDCHVGGAIYVFMRGIDTQGGGIHRDCPPRELIEALDRLFSGKAVA